MQNPRPNARTCHKPIRQSTELTVPGDVAFGGRAGPNAGCGEVVRLCDAGAGSTESKLVAPIVAADGAGDFRLSMDGTTVGTGAAAENVRDANGEALGTLDGAAPGIASDAVDANLVAPGPIVSAVDAMLFGNDGSNEGEIDGTAERVGAMLWVNEGSHDGT